MLSCWLRKSSPSFGDDTVVLTSQAVLQLKTSLLSEGRLNFSTPQDGGEVCHRVRLHANEEMAKETRKLSYPVGLQLVGKMGLSIDSDFMVYLKKVTERESNAYWDSPFDSVASRARTSSPSIL